MVSVLRIAPTEQIRGNITVPGDKSISHRSIMLGAIAEGITEVKGFLEGSDCLATLNAFQEMGVRIHHSQLGYLVIEGVGKQGLKNPTKPLNMGNSGTSIRLLAGLIAGAGLQATLTGDASLNKRPMKRVIHPLSLMGARIESTEESTAPLSILPATSLTGISYQLPVASAQVKSCLLLAGLYAKGTTEVIEPSISRDHTERMLQTFDYPIEKCGNILRIQGNDLLKRCTVEIPGDISSAAFFIVAALIAQDAFIKINNVGINPTRIGVISILKKMGAQITLVNERMLGNEPVADIEVTSSQLVGIEIPQNLVPLAIDEFPAIFIAAAAAKGKTILRGAAELRVKESDRIQAMAEGLQTLGVATEILPDGLIIEGGNMKGGEINSAGDHRIAMAFAVASLRANNPIVIHDCSNIATSFPNFVEIGCFLGMKITRLE